MRVRVGFTDVMLPATGRGLQQRADQRPTIAIRSGPPLDRESAPADDRAAVPSLCQSPFVPFQPPRTKTFILSSGGISLKNTHAVQGPQGSREI